MVPVATKIELVGLIALQSAIPRVTATRKPCHFDTSTIGVDYAYSAF
jgi:hypothetical protein